MHNLHGPNLFETRCGSVLQCTCCGRIEIAFGRHTLRVCEEEFETLVRTVERAWEQVRDEHEADRWQLKAASGGRAVTISLSKASLRGLHELLAGGWKMYALRKSLEAVASGCTRPKLLDASLPEAS